MPVFPTTVEVYAGIDGETAADSSYVYYAEATTISIQKEYYDDPDTDYDWAAIELDWNLGDAVGYYGMISNWYESGAEVYSYGYPGDKEGHTMWEAPGNLIGKTDYRYMYDFDTYDGQSGSPIFMTHENGSVYVCGVHTYSGSTDNGGTRFNSFIYHYIFSYRGYYNYTHYVGTISPDEYGFADAYPTNPSYETNYDFLIHCKRYLLSDGGQGGSLFCRVRQSSPFSDGLSNCYTLNGQLTVISPVLQ